ncbi:MAG: ABC transporter substrate-binding protein [Dehalococcoidia bacterium]|nr:ABC transporter substrate-binding protein [Dehalococcoidia bacterium]
MERTNYWTRRIRRRTLLTGSATASAGLAGWALAGCGDDDDNGGTGGNGSTETPGGVRPGTATAPTPTVAGEQIKRDGIFNLRQSAPFANISIYNGLDSGLYFGLITPIYDHLWYTPLDTGIRENFLAENIEQPDPLHFTVTLKEAVFQDKPPISGRKVTANDVKASFEAASQATKISNSSWWTQVLDKVDAVDERTVAFTLKAVDAWTFSTTNAGSPLAGSILPEEHAKDQGQLEKDPIGSGLFEFVSQENGTNFALKRNETYREKGRPNLAGYQYKLIQEQAAALAAFSAKEIDSVVPGNKLERDQLTQQHGDAVFPDLELNRAVWMVQPRGDGEWADPRVSQAISLALNKDEMVELMGFGEGQASGPVPPTFASHALTEAEIAETFGRHDPVEAKALLDASGFDTTREYQIKFITPGDSYAQFAQIVQSHLDKHLGIKTKLVGEDFGKWLAQSLYGSDYDGFIVYPTLEYDDPSSYIGAYQLEIGGRPNWAGWENEALNDIVVRQKATLDDTERAKLVHDLQRQAWEVGAPFIPTFVRVSGSVYWKHVKGLVTGRGSYRYLAGSTYIDKG